MRYTGAKFKLCRREGINLFGPSKYDVRKNRKIPGQHGESMPRLSEYGKLLRNKQVLKRMYLLTEKQFRRTIIDLAGKYAKNKGMEHDKAAIMFLERRLDAIVVKAGFASTIMQARQMVTHGHFLLNGKKHNVPSTLVEISDTLEVKDKLKTSNLYANLPINAGAYSLPSWINVQKNKFTIEVTDLPKSEEISLPVDILKVIEYYARA